MDHFIALNRYASKTIQVGKNKTNQHLCFRMTRRRPHSPWRDNRFPPENNRFPKEPEHNKFNHERLPDFHHNGEERGKNNQ